MNADKDQRPEEKKTSDEVLKNNTQEFKEPEAAARAETEPPQRQALPQASISFLCSTLATQAFIALGLVPHPITKQTESNLDHARHFIDMLDVIQNKTQGNLDSDEMKQLDALLFDLRMQFVEASSKNPA